MVPKWCQYGPKTAPRGPQKQQQNENETFWAPRGATTKINSPLGTQVGPQVEQFWINFGNFVLTCLRRRFFIDVWLFLGGLRTFIFCFSLRRKYKFDIFVKVVVGIVFDPQNPPKICRKMVPRRFQEVLEGF